MPHRNNAAPVDQVGQQVAKGLTLHLNAATMETIGFSDNVEFNAHVALLGSGGLNGMAQTEVATETDPTDCQARKLEPDQAVVFNEVARLMLQGGKERDETKPKLVLGPAGTGKTHLIFAVLDAARDTRSRSLFAPVSMLSQKQRSEVTHFRAEWSGGENCC